MAVAEAGRDRQEPSSSRALVAAMALGVGLRLAFVLTGSGTSRYLFADSESYLVVARALPRALWSPDAATVTATLWRTPVYPSFLWASGGSHHLTFVVLVQCLIGGALNVWLVHRLGQRLLGAGPAIVAAAICAIDPATIAHNLLIATETLTTTWLLLLLLATVAVLRRVDLDRSALLPAAAAGLSGALLTLTRPNLLLLAPAAAAFVALATRRRRGVAAAAVLVVVATLPVAAWMARNDHVAGSPVLSTVAGQNLVDFGLASAAHDQGRLGWWTTDAARVGAAVAATPEADRLSRPVDGDTANVATDRAWRSEGWAVLRRHPAGATAVITSTTAKTALAPGTEMLTAHLRPSMHRWTSGPLRVLGAGLLLALYAGVLVGSVSLGRSGRWRELVLLLGTLAVYLASSVGPWLYVRFRVPVLPVLALLAGVGARWLRERRGTVTEPGATVD